MATERNGAGASDGDGDGDGPPRSGRSMSDLRWYQALAVWKAVVFMEGNYKRALAGSVDDPYLKSFGDGVVEIADRALAVTRDGF